MECPRCRSPNPDEAVQCGRCAEPLPTRRPSKTGAFVAFRAVGTRIEGWSIAGPLVINERGLVFFVREMRNMKMNFTQAGVRSGGLIGLAIGAVVDSASGRYERPAKIVLRRTSDIIDDVRSAVADAPDIPPCGEFFTIERQDITRISRAYLGGLKVETPQLSLRIGALDPIEKASGFLKLKRYPIET